MALFSARGAERLRAVHEELLAERAEGLERASITQILQALIDRGDAVIAVDVHKGWMEVDSFEDYRRAWAETR
jgi:phosphoenolpyruvate phosphomutase